jgi:allophanate hydrolase subunit 2
MIEILDPGYYITIQDLGRFGYSNYGVPQSGCMDIVSAKNANLLLSNSINEPLFEICIMGGKFLFKKEAKISLSGALFEVLLNNKEVSNDLLIEVHKGDVLSFGRAIKGNRIYLAVKGGIVCKSVMGSSSMYRGISEDFIVRKKDVFKFSQNPSKNLSHEKVDSNIFD